MLTVLYMIVLGTNGLEIDAIGKFKNEDTCRAVMQYIQRRYKETDDLHFECTMYREASFAPLPQRKPLTYVQIVYKLDQWKPTTPNPGPLPKGAMKP